MADGTCAYCAGPATRTFCSQNCYHLSQRTSDRVEATCVCGKTFETRAARVAAGRGRYCSKACLYANRPRPSGLTYEIKAENAAWFKPGRDAPTGPDSPGWRGDDVGYQALHRWVKANRAKPEACEHCARTDRPLDWANRSHEYRRDLDDWIALCRQCHRDYDRDWRGAAVSKYGAANMQGRRA